MVLISMSDTVNANNFEDFHKVRVKLITFTNLNC